MSFSVEGLKAREVLDSRGNPTVEVDLLLKGGAMGRAAVPSGASTGTREALELRDGEKGRYLGKGVRKAVRHVNTDLHKVLVGKTFGNQRDLDDAILSCDGTPNKERLGANALLGVSMAFCRAAAQQNRLPLYDWIRQQFALVRMGSVASGVLPLPMMNIVNGGAHAHNGLDIQEFMVLPAGAPSFQEALRMGVEVFHALRSVLKAEGLATTVGDEGGFAPSFDEYEEKHEQVLEFVVQAVESAGYKIGRDLYLGLDVAASEFYENGVYQFEGRARTSDEMVDYYQKLVREYPIISIEDGLAEKDWAGWAKMTQALKNQCQIVGDDIFVTNPTILKEGIEKGVANSVLVKLNQIGTVSETLHAVGMAQQAGYTTVISHRSGETEDAFIADLAVGVAAGQIKTGSASRSDRTAKYNQLLRIEEELGSLAQFLGIKSMKWSSSRS